MAHKLGKMIVVGLTGSIGMGKSNAALVLRRLGIPVYDADGAVHALLGPGGQAVHQVGDVFPQALAVAESTGEYWVIWCSATRLRCAAWNPFCIPWFRSVEPRLSDGHGATSRSDRSARHPAPL